MEIRAKDRDGRFVYGYHCIITGTHYLLLKNAEFIRHAGTHSIIEDMFVEIDISTAAEDTGKDDKHGDRIFGCKGNMVGGDTVNGPDCEDYVYWCSHTLTWIIRNTKQHIRLAHVASAELEIVKEKDK
ncbi:hypothetical protein LCGC14_2753050 [marine sediment metagenome]|uniref:YopX protein domain-containing protein n=1 Tax=marine sediment metagenome TaxID=412755 RepID=A0A0F8Z1E3_9ZZZZ